MRVLPRILITLLALTLTGSATAQWTNRYPRVAGYGHHVYLEGYELPLLTNGPIDAVTLDDNRLVFASRGWLWILDRRDAVARRLTSGPAIDARPAVSPDRRTVAFVRDHDNDTTIVLLDLESGSERVLVDTGSIDIDPAFTPDGAALVYTSASAGDLDVWVVGLDGSEAQRLTREPGLELAASPTPSGGTVYLAKTRGGVDELRWRHDGSEQVLLQARIASQARPALDASGTRVAINVPIDDTTQLLVLDLERPHTPVRLAPEATLPLTPAWSHGGESVFFSEADSRQRLHLFEAPTVGGPASEVAISEWDWGQATATVRVRTRLNTHLGFVEARLSAWSDGHPLVAEAGMTYLDGKSGWPFFYSNGDIEFTVPAGPVTVTAARGLSTVPMTATVEVPAGGSALIEFDLETVWPDEGDWASGDHHFHLNYGGAYSLPPTILADIAAGEGLDVATPLTANLHNRYEDAANWDWRSTRLWPLVRFGQEIRSHFLGHIGVIGHREMYWPWIWGPGYEVYGQDDRPNGDALRELRDQGGLGYYVHPVSVAEPFAAENLGRLPVEVVVDAVLGDLDALEVVCLWSDEVGTANLWHRFLNLGIAVAPSAGTDIMSNLVRTMAVGATRVYVHQPLGLTWSNYLEGLRAGRSFVTNGPLLDFVVSAGGVAVRPGGMVGAGTVEYELRLATVTEVDRVEILVNGEVVATEPGLADPGSRILRGRLTLPAGGWVAARASGGESRWPAMDSYPWAHSAPIWIDHVGSSDASARSAAANDLLRALDIASARLEAGYSGAEIPRLRQRFAQARQRLLELGAADSQ